MTKWEFSSFQCHMILPKSFQYTDLMIQYWISLLLSIVQNNSA